LGAVGTLFGGNCRLMTTADGLGNAGAVVALTAGEARRLTVTATGLAGVPLQVRLAWITPQRRQHMIDEAVGLAKTATTAVLFAFNEGTEGEDRASLALPDSQDALIEAVASANRRTAVVLNTGDPVLMPWLDRTPAVLQMWYPGQEGADATAALLLGEANPAGKLPVTYPREEADAPTAAAERYPGVDGHAAYGEGIFVGYRHYDATGTTPLFPFGHGLSYTTFRYSGLAVTRRGGTVTVAFTVRNTGRRSGVEVAQVYLGPARSVAMPQRQLAGFARVSLPAGAAKRVTITIPKQTLSYWSTARQGWVVAEGKRQVMVGSSSRDIRLTGSIVVGQ
ncbi:MAG: glycoside hydrolase family 3 C-terminal domain-containing protein, partial [Micromonosporaceae bacterium]|nr:glycoside hydrolase family 3 C-terminal domain-containing protein [Micromonosporaceae bacterium]